MAAVIAITAPTVPPFNIPTSVGWLTIFVVKNGNSIVVIHCGENVVRGSTVTTNLMIKGNVKYT